MKQLSPLAAVLLTLATAGAEPVREIEITSNPPDPATGQQLFNVRLTPDETAEYERISFDCVLRQAFTDQATHTKSSMKIHEPAVFTYRRKDVKMVQDLDTHISFRIPVGHQRLQEIFGQTAFNTNYPVTVDRMVITTSGPQLSWTNEVPASGVHRPPFKVKPPPPPQPFKP